MWDFNNHFFYDLQLCASCLFINFKDFLDHVRVIFYYTITSLSRLDHSIIICCSRKIAKNMNGSISPCSPLTTRARRVCHANRARVCEGTAIHNLRDLSLIFSCRVCHWMELIGERKQFGRYSNAIVRGKKIQKLHVNVSLGILKRIYSAWGLQSLSSSNTGGTKKKGPL